MSFVDPPAAAAWHHHDARDGFEVTFFRRAGRGRRVEGTVTGVEDGQAWAVSYAVELAPSWETRSAHVRSYTTAGTRSVALERADGGTWLVDGTPAPGLAGCADVDLEASAMTNAFPVRRLELAVGEEVAAPAAYVRLDLRVERLEQTYRRVAAAGPGYRYDGPGYRYDYAAPGLGFRCRLVYDTAGLVLSYPGLASRRSTGRAPAP